jgi:plastocyanin
MSGSLVVKQGTKVMFDNRDAAAHTIAMKGVSVKVGALNFAVVTASTLGTYNITCDGGGAASINVEK